MESLCFTLEEALQRQGEILQEMFGAVSTHNQALRQNDVAALREIIAREEEIAARLKEEDRQRENVHEALVEKLDLPGDTSLSQLLPSLPYSHRSRLDQLSNQLKNTAGEITGVVKLNGILTRRAMQFNEQLLKLIRTIHNNTYQHDGKSTAPVSFSSPLINKTV